MQELVRQWLMNYSRMTPIYSNEQFEQCAVHLIQSKEHVLMKWGKVSGCIGLRNFKGSFEDVGSTAK